MQLLKTMLSMHCSVSHIWQYLYLEGLAEGMLLDLIGLKNIFPVEPQSFSPTLYISLEGLPCLLSQLKILIVMNDQI